MLKSPRVEIKFPKGASEASLPFVMGVMADLSGAWNAFDEVPDDQQSARGEIGGRKFLEIDVRNFDERLAAMKPRVTFSIPNYLSEEDSEIEIDLTFKCLDDFSPGAVARRVPVLRELLDSKPESRDGREQTQVQTEDGSIARDEARIDELLSRYVNSILHHTLFQKLEGTWKGLFRLVSHTELGQMLKIKVFNISKQELGNTLQSYAGARRDESPIFDKVYAREFGRLDGVPYGCLVGDYYFDQSAPDVATLAEMAKIASEAHCPFVTAASPRALNMESWQELNEPDQLADVLEEPSFREWRSLRDSAENPDSNFLFLTMPRFLARLPYSPEENPTRGFNFREDCDGTVHKTYTWSNAAYLIGVNINRAFENWGWCTMIRGVESGGIVNDLPVHIFPAPDGCIDMKCPTEIAIDERSGMKLERLGFIPLTHKQGTDIAVFFETRSVQQRKDFEGRTEAQRAATDSQLLSCNLRYLFPACRFAHYVKAFADSQIGAFVSCEEVQRRLQDWIDEYVDPKTDATHRQRRRRPLTAAQITVEEVLDRPGHSDITLHITPAFQLAPINCTLTRIVHRRQPR